VEEKIRILQHQKNQLVANVLGDEGFASSLGIDDLNFILNHGDEEDTPTPSDDEEDDN
jgi:SNF2 family DNA or RNA helicase